MLAGIVAWAAMSTAERVSAGARGQLAVPARYDASYKSIAYPLGDVHWDRGACTDVVVRAYRAAGYDLQRLVHEDRKAQRLPTDTNIDHRRVRNLAVFFARRGQTLPLADRWQAGDVVCWVLDSGQDHIGIVTNRVGRSGDRIVVHNIDVTKEEDALHKWRIVGHYRYPPR